MKAQPSLETTSDMLLGFARSRARNLPTRLLAAFVIVLTNVTLLGVWPACIWLAAYCALQVLEQPLLRALARWERGGPRVREALMLSVLGASAVLFSAICIPLWLSPGWTGPAVAVLLLCGSATNAAVVGRGTKKAFYVSLTPVGLLLFFGPFLARAAHHVDIAADARAPLIVGASLVVANVITAFMASEKIRLAEAAARLELEKGRLKALAATDAKSEFVAAVSHDLRTPLTAIMASACAIGRDAHQPEQVERAEMIGEAVVMMRTLLDDLLDLAKIEAGRMGVEVIAFDLRHLVDDVARFWSEEAGRKGLTLTVSGAEHLPRLAGGDPTRIRQILNNLLSNAVKFTSAGGVTIDAACTPGPDGGHAVKLAVIDTGPGLAPDQVARLFNRFEQTNGAVARHHGGTGLGLAISRELARLMGGDLVAQSAPDRGARFTVTCRLPPAPEVAAAAAEATAVPQDAGDLRCLVVDDHELNRRALTLLLEPLGVVPVLACDGGEALTLLGTQTFDVVLMDLNMAGLDGRETTRRLRACGGANRHVPVIAVTGALEPETLNDCLAAGMDAWVEKPLEPKALYAALERVLGYRNADGRSAGDFLDQDAEAA